MFNLLVIGIQSRGILLGAAQLFRLHKSKTSAAKTAFLPKLKISGQGISGAST